MAFAALADNDRIYTEAQEFNARLVRELHQVLKLFSYVKY